VLLVLEDLHWADRSTRDLLTFLSRVLHRERVAVVVTYRSDDLHRRHPLRAVVAELIRLPGVTAIELPPLGYADMADHLSALASAPLDATALHRIVTRAEGNPYYGEELLAAGCAQSVLPTGLAALLLGRIERVSATAQQVLRAAAVAGRRVEDDIVRGAAGLTEADFEAGLREAFAHQLLVSDGAEGYAFRHGARHRGRARPPLPGQP
jgi:predicted ATPase